MNPSVYVQYPTVKASLIDLGIKARIITINDTLAVSQILFIRRAKCSWIFCTTSKYTIDNALKIDIIQTVIMIDSAVQKKPPGMAISFASSTAGKVVSLVACKVKTAMQQMVTNALRTARKPIEIVKGKALSCDALIDFIKKNKISSPIKAGKATLSLLKQE